MADASEFLDRLRSWEPAESGGAVIRTIDMHTGGEPLRVIVDGYPELRGDTILQMRGDALSRFDEFRTQLMWEPRGHADMYGCVIVPPVSEGSDFGVLFLHNEGYSTMCGHAIIALSVLAGRMRKKQVSAPLKIDTPAGQVVAWLSAEETDAVSFLNVASFVVDLDADVDVPEVGTVQYDLAFGGAFYAFVDAVALGVLCIPANSTRLKQLATSIKSAIVAARRIEHPVDDELAFLYGIIFVDDAHADGNHSRHVCVFAEGEVDRSPTGTGVSARAALLNARGQLSTGEAVTIESIIGSTFTVRTAAVTRYAGRSAIIPEVTGSAYITGTHTFVVDPDDPLKNGFLVS